ncbi:MAG: hypothetical protein ABR607_02950 [Pyrinomonadaceae bacterium]
MKRQMTISVALLLTILLTAMTWAPAVRGQTPGDNVNMRKIVIDTGAVSLGLNQALRVTGDWNGDGKDVVQFRQMTYMPEGCSGGVCKHSIASQSTSAPVKLASGEAASIDIVSSPEYFAVRAIVLSEHPNLHVNAMIIDMTTGNIICVLVGG